MTPAPTEIPPQPTCNEEDCDRPVQARGLCSSDYSRQRRPFVPCPVPGCMNRGRYNGPCRRHRDEFAAVGMKWCGNRECDEPLKPLAKFNKNRAMSDGLQGWCAKCHSGLAMSWQSRHPGRQHGLTVEQFQNRLKQQNGKCDICLKDYNDESITPCVDHDHMHCSGKRGCPECVRGLLCQGCNKMLAQAYDNPAILRRWSPSRKRPQALIDSAIAYLEKWHAEMSRRGIRPSPEDALWQDVFGALGRLITEMA